MKRFIAIEGLALLFVIFLFLGLEVLIDYQYKESKRLGDVLVSRGVVYCDTTYCSPKGLVRYINAEIDGLSNTERGFRLKKLFGSDGRELFSQLKRSINRKDSLRDFQEGYLWYLYLLYFALRFVGWAVAVLSKKDE